MKSQRTSALFAKIDGLKKAEARAFGPRHGKNDFYDYLKAVLDLYWSWKDAKARKSRRRELNRIYGMNERKGQTALHAIVEASSSQKKTTKNRWVQGLRYADLHRAKVQNVGLSAFCLGKRKKGKVLSRNRGGIAGCATRWAKRVRNGKRAKARVKRIRTAFGRAWP